jgi:hypothetical protein
MPYCMPGSTSPEPEFSSPTRPLWALCCSQYWIHITISSLIPLAPIWKAFFWGGGQYQRLTKEINGKKRK